MKYQGLFHTHRNPKFGTTRDEPLFILISGWSCAECRKEKVVSNCKSSRRTKPLPQTVPSRGKRRRKVGNLSGRNGLANRTSSPSSRNKQFRLFGDEQQ